MMVIVGAVAAAGAEDLGEYTVSRSARLMEMLFGQDRMREAYPQPYDSAARGWAWCYRILGVAFIVAAIWVRWAL